MCDDRCWLKKILCKVLPIPALVVLALSFALTPLSAEEKQFGEYNLKYGYSFFTPSQRSPENGGADSVHKLPGEFKIWLNGTVDMFIRNDTLKASRTGTGWTNGAGDTLVGLDLLLRTESKRTPEIDFTYDAKLPETGKIMIGDVELSGFVGTKSGSDRINGVYLAYLDEPSLRDVSQDKFKRLKRILTKKYGFPNASPDGRICFWASASGNVVLSTGRPGERGSVLLSYTQNEVDPRTVQHD